MTFSKQLPLAIMAWIAASIPVGAMPTATTQPGLQGAVMSGGSFNVLPASYTLGADVAYGIPTRLLGQTNTEVTADMLRLFLNNVPINIDTVGVLQPIITIKNMPISAEAGLDYVTEQSPLTGLDESHTGGYFGVRASCLPARHLTLNLMARYHSVSGGAWQAGLGLSRPITSRASWQLDYYRFSARVNTFLIGVRLYATPSPAERSVN